MFLKGGIVPVRDNPGWGQGYPGIWVADVPGIPFPTFYLQAALCVLIAPKSRARKRHINFEHINFLKVGTTLEQPAG